MADTIFSLADLQQDLSHLLPLFAFEPKQVAETPQAHVGKIIYVLLITKGNVRFVFQKRFVEDYVYMAYVNRAQTGSLLMQTGLMQTGLIVRTRYRIDEKAKSKLCVALMDWIEGFREDMIQVANGNLEIHI